jgi:hypothetical protein
MYEQSQGLRRTPQLETIDVTDPLQCSMLLLFLPSAVASSASTSIDIALIEYIRTVIAYIN